MGKDERQKIKSDLGKCMDFNKLINLPSANTSAVDKLNIMYLSDNADISNGQKGKRIQDVFNDLTVDTNLYKKKCERFSAIRNDTTNTNFNIGKNEWDYDDEKIINGGNITDTLTGFYPNENNYQKIEK